MTCNEIDINILKERLALLEIKNDNLIKENDNLIKGNDNLLKENENLRKENEILKKNTKSSNNPRETKSLVSSSSLNKLIPIFNNKTKGCNCKGNCSNKVCGCMKKNRQCNEACKCNTKVCKNKLQERDKENFENSEIKLARKLTFLTDEDTLEENPVRLSAILEVEEIETKRKSKKHDKNISKDRKESLTSQVGKENVEDAKLEKSKKQKDLNKENVKSKKQKKESKSRRAASVEAEVEKKEEHVPDNSKVTVRSRKIRKSVQSEKEKVDIDDIEKVESNSGNEIPISINLERIKSTGVTSCIKNVPSLEQPTNSNNSGSRLSSGESSIKEESNETSVSKNATKYLKLNPMQPTRQLSRSPILAVTAVPKLETSFTSSSPPIYRSYLNSQNITVFSPPPEILQDLNAEEVDSEKFQSKLATCRKCKRKFFPHRVKLHEAICGQKHK